ncbi:hypothetical protein KY290_038594 [Solanum tuberosum]|uniref:ABC transporter domain-containing protein n=1 Tax=Solanum tuberosum TaxID=4113 RepID=A0ABQ7U011_SOLTU|nr:hypothetical protein KY290_038594 [Solanum tuberosum]
MASAIMGPSGSGKTTLLNVLAGQTKASPKLNLSGLLDINGVPFTNKIYKFAYVRQDDLLFSQLTIRETLHLAAELQLQDRNLSTLSLVVLVSRLFKRSVVLIHKLVMQKFVELVFGEKKRMSLACELIASPSVVFADEPATGLDAFQAEQVMETLRYLAQDRHTVICSIHHSRGSVYAKFDDVVLLAGGSLINAGPANDEVQAYFSKFGLAVVENCSTMQYTADQTKSYREAIFMDNNKKPFMFTIWDDLTDNEGVVLLQLLHEHAVILAKRVAVTYSIPSRAKDNEQMLFAYTLRSSSESSSSLNLASVDNETISISVIPSLSSRMSLKYDFHFLCQY